MIETLARSSAKVVQKRLGSAVDPFSAFAALLPGAPADTALFESKDGLQLLLHKAAVRAECRGEIVLLRALSANGESLLRTMGKALAGHLVSNGHREITLRFPPDQGHDSEARLLAPLPLHAIRTLIRSAMPEASDPFAAAALGVVAFEYATLGENIPSNQDDPIGFPDYIFWIPESLFVFERGSSPRLLCTAFSDEDPDRSALNHQDAVVRLAALVDAYEHVAPYEIGVEDRAAAGGSVDLSDEEYAAVVSQLKEEIAAGEVYQIVPSRTFSAPCPDPLRSFALLRRLEPNSYRFFIRCPEFILFGASPETSVRVYREDNWNNVEVRPIAGTRKRGDSDDEDDRLEAEMRLDQKELSEHMMLVDLARNDVARISIAGTRRVARLLTVERYAKVMHLVSSVTGRLGIGFDAVDALSACLNVGTLTGAPKLRATELLRQVERTKRGPYGGAIGWLNGAGLMDTAVVIRSALVRDGIAFVRAGAGVVHDSDPISEADETRRKASALLAILGQEGEA